MRAGPEDESASASPGCSHEEQTALTKLMPFITLVDPGTLVALLSASVEDFDSEAMALTEPAGAFTLSLASVDADCMLAIRPRNATNITLAFSSFELGTFSNLRVYDGLSIAAPLIAVLRSTDSPRSITSRGNALLLVVVRDPDNNYAGEVTATYRADDAPLELSGGVPAASAIASACVPPK